MILLNSDAGITIHERFVRNGGGKLLLLLGFLWFGMGFEFMMREILPLIAAAERESPDERRVSCPLWDAAILTSAMP